MKIKKGLGSIPKSLAWIDSSDHETLQASEPIKEKKQQEQKRVAVAEKITKPIVGQSQEKTINVDEICSSFELNASTKGLPEGWTRATFILKQEINEKIKALAYWDRITVKEVLHEALTIYLQGKNVRAIPKKKELL